MVEQISQESGQANTSSLNVVIFNRITGEMTYKSFSNIAELVATAKELIGQDVCIHAYTGVPHKITKGPFKRLVVGADVYDLFDIPSVDVSDPDQFDLSGNLHDTFVALSDIDEALADAMLEDETEDTDVYETEDTGVWADGRSEFLDAMNFDDDIPFSNDDVSTTK